MVSLTLQTAARHAVTFVVDYLTEQNLRWQRPRPGDYALPAHCDCSRVFANMARYVGVDFAALLDAHHQAALAEDEYRAGQLLVALGMDVAEADYGHREDVSAAGDEDPVLQKAEVG